LVDILFPEALLQDIPHLDLVLYLDSYDNPDTALNCGMMLRECLKHESLARVVLNSKGVWKFFDYVEMSTFDIASDAFSTFKVQQTFFMYNLPMLGEGGRCLFQTSDSTLRRTC